MDIAKEIIEKLQRDQAREFCQKIEWHWQTGVGFRPSALFPRGEAVGTDGQHIDFSSLREWDRRIAPHFLNKIHSIEGKFPDIVGNHSKALSAAMRALEGLARSQS